MPWTDLQETDWAYIAGLLDGEGYLGITSRSRQHKGSRQIIPSKSYRPRIAINMTNKQIIEYLHKLFGGFMCEKINTNIKWKNTYSLDIVDYQTIKIIIQKCLPYFKIKQEQALMLLKFPHNIKCNQYTTKLTQNTYNLKYALYSQSLILNKRGRIVNAI